MPVRTHRRLKPRKLPVQARSQVTVEAIFEATIQVLLRGGARMLTTNRIAETAGVSIGTLYQYFPGREALLYALVGRHLERTSAAVEHACLVQRGAPLETCADTFVDAYIDAKAGNVEVSRALYYASTEIDMHDLGAAMLERLQAAVRGLLENASGARFDALDAVVVSWVAIVTGGTRLIFEQDRAAERLPPFCEQLRQMSRAYLAAQNTERAM